MNFSKLALFLAFLFLVQGSAFAQDWDSFQSQQQINDLVDNGTELLMATDAGLVVMNKTTFEKTVFNMSNSNLSNNHIQTVTETTNGDIWIGTFNTVIARFDGTTFQDITTPQSDELDQHTELFDLKVAPNGDFWLATSDGVFHKQGPNWLHYDEDEMGTNFFEAWDIEINSSGDVFIASRDVSRFSNGIWTNTTAGTTLSGYLDADLFFNDAGDLFVAGDLDKIGRFDGSNWETYPIDFNGSEVIGLTEDVDGNMFFNTRRDGIFQLLDNVWKQQGDDEQAVAYNNNTAYFYIDAENKRWLNNNIHISVNNNGTIQSTLIAPHSIENNFIKMIHKGENGNLYFLTSSQNNISVVDPSGNWSFLPLPTTRQAWENFNDILFLSDNDIWMASNMGLHHYDGTEWTFNDLGICRNFAVDSQGKIYVLTSAKILMIDNGVMTEYNVDNSQITSFIQTGHGIDADDNLWISSFTWDGDNAIQKVSPDGSWTTYSGDDHPAMNRTAGDFVFEDNGNVWIASDFSGAIKFDGTTFTNPIAENSGQVTNTDIESIAIDETGTIYFAHDYGITTLFDGAWENLAIDNIENSSSSGIKAFCKFDDEGTLWWAGGGHGVFSNATFVPLPVELVSFKANSFDSKSIQLSWQTASEENNSHFSIEHSMDGSTFREIGTQNGYGTTANIQNYAYKHIDLENGWHYYRLKQVDFDGKYEYSNTVNAKIQTREGSLVIAPNPATNNITIQTKTPFEGDVSFQMINTQGQVVLGGVLQNGTENLELNISNLPNGVYYLQLLEGNELKIKKVIKQD